MHPVQSCLFSLGTKRSFRVITFQSSVQSNFGDNDSLLWTRTGQTDVLASQHFLFFTRWNQRLSYLKPNQIKNNPLLENKQNNILPGASSPWQIKHVPSTKVFQLNILPKEFSIERLWDSGCCTPTTSSPRSPTIKKSSQPLRTGVG